MEMRRRLNVLLVDDDMADRKIIKRTLAENATEVIVTEAVSVAEGLGFLQEHKFDVILLDYRMPGATGIEMVQELRSRPDLGSIAIVMMSASENESLAVKCIESGAQDFIQKTDLQRLNLHRAIIHAQKRFELEHKLHQNYLNVKHLAEKDPLTGLSNRHHFNQIIDMLIENGKHSKVEMALLLIDLDDFKYVNDTLGHDAGDRLLIEFSTRVKKLLRRHESFARLGGDEFAIVLNGIKSTQQVRLVTQRIQNALSVPVTLGQTEVVIKASIGASVYPAQAADKDTLVKYADIAMYQAKANGKGKMELYDPVMSEQYSRMYDIQNGMKQLIQEAAFNIHFQPVVDLQTNQKIGFEALIRWPNMKNQFVPDEFIPIAEKNSDIHAIGEWVIDRAIRQISNWQKRHAKDRFVAINISPVQLQNHTITEYLINRAEAYSVNPQNIVLEITETALFEKEVEIKRSIETLSDYGFLISLDDFGVGYSSISHLIEYPISIVKLDKSLFQTEEGEQKRKAVFEALAEMLKRLRMTVVAEGIETQEHLDMCKKLNIDHGQGFFLGRPAEAVEFDAEMTLIA
ncbi:putative bifunctional diguanylate cyclase/phosphodiesterase [Glaciecola sp. 2405UD65-10]|uniref:putative bifunctional diguanylate cyclase/phosphodiesterase n=1 Tax=Glaciecola sp. 2405UD65-10 TaxID=3397244 RepID=UPI003B595D4A